MPIGQACRLHNGRAYGLHEWEQSGVPVIRLQNLTGGNDYYFSNLKLADNKYCDHGDLLFMWSATFGPRIWLGERAIYHYHIWKVVPKADVATKAYLFHKFESITEEKKAHSTNGGTMLHFTKSDMEGTLIAVPGVAEQESIANALSDADALIESLDQLIAKKRQIKQGAMQELLTGKRRLPGFGGKWEVKRLGDVGKCIRGVTYNGDNDLWPHDTSYTKRLLRSNNVQKSTVVIDDIQFVNLNRVAPQQLLRKNDILVCMANGSKALVGNAGFFDVADGHEYTFGAFMGCFRTESTASNPAFVFYLFQTARYRDYINNLLAGSSINNLSPGSIESLEFPLPQMTEQTAIATVLSDMDTELAALESRLAKARQIKQGMMQELLTGRIRLL